eukprot:492429_1
MDAQEVIDEYPYKSYCMGGRIMTIISLLLAYRIVRKDFQNRRIFNDNHEIISPSLLHIETGVFIISILYGICVALIFSPRVCVLNFKIGWILNGMQNDILGLFQIRRMQLCLSQDRIHSKFGYPGWVFKMLYTIGVVHAMYIVCVFTVLSGGILFIEVTQYGTFWRGCVSRFEQIAAVQYSLMIGVYVIWDWSTLFLYFYKISQFRKKSNEKSEVVFMRVKAILNRVVLLTILAEFFYIALLVTTFAMAMGLSEAYGWNIQIIFACPDIFNIVFVVALMSEHNNHEYIKFIAIVKRFRIFFCCPMLVKDAAEYYENGETIVKENQSHNSGRTNVETYGTSDQMKMRSHTVKMEHSSFLEQSEMTQTIQVQSPNSSVQSPVIPN